MTGPLITIGGFNNHIIYRTLSPRRRLLCGLFNLSRAKLARIRTLLLTFNLRSLLQVNKVIRYRSRWTGPPIVRGNTYIAACQPLKLLACS